MMNEHDYHRPEKTLERDLAQALPVTALRVLYTRSLRQIILDNPKIFPPIPQHAKTETPNKPYIINALTILLKSKTLLKQCYLTLSPQHQELITLLAWNKLMSVEQAEQKLGFKVTTTFPKKQRVVEQIELKKRFLICSIS